MAKSYEEMVAEARDETEQVGVEELHEAREAGEELTVLDVREPGEWQAGHIPGAKHIPRGMLECLVADELPDRDHRIVVHCAVGGRGALAAKTLQEMGYTNVANMQGGTNAWSEKGYDIEVGG
ncbi:MAG: rhodanese-like domain-containing protein [Rubrobacteraceae bacterium]